MMDTSLADGFDTGGFAREFAQVVELRASHFAPAQHLDLFDSRRMEWEDALDADAIGDLAYGKVRAIAAAADLDHEAFEGLDALLFALDDADLESDGIAHAKRGQVLTQRAIFDLLNNAVHGSKHPGSRAVRS